MKFNVINWEGNRTSLTLSDALCKHWRRSWSIGQFLESGSFPMPDERADAEEYALKLAVVKHAKRYNPGAVKLTLVGYVEQELLEDLRDVQTEMLCQLLDERRGR